MVTMRTRASIKKATRSAWLKASVVVFAVLAALSVGRVSASTFETSTRPAPFASGEVSTAPGGPMAGQHRPSANSRSPLPTKAPANKGSDHGPTPATSPEPPKVQPAPRDDESQTPPTPTPGSTPPQPPTRLECSVPVAFDSTLACGSNLQISTLGDPSQALTTGFALQVTETIGDAKAARIELVGADSEVRIAETVELQEDETRSVSVSPTRVNSGDRWEVTLS